jgi:hypothetical protein
VSDEPDEVVRVQIDDVVKLSFTLCGSHVVDLDRGVVTYRTFSSDGRVGEETVPIEEALNPTRRDLTDDEQAAQRFLVRRFGGDPDRD